MNIARDLAFVAGLVMVGAGTFLAYGLPSTLIVCGFALIVGALASSRAAARVEHG